MKVSISGKKFIDPLDLPRIEKIIENQGEIVAREIKNINTLKLHFKRHEKSSSEKAKKTKDKGKTRGNRLFTVKILIDAPTKPLEVSSSSQDMITALRLSFNKVKRHIEKHFKR